MDPRIVLAALLAAVAAAGLASTAVRPHRRLESRLRPYVQLRRTRLGQRADVAAALAVNSTAGQTTLSRVFGPITERFASAISALVDVGDDRAIERRLRQAGMTDIDARQYRITQATRALAGVIGGTLAGIWLGTVWGSPAFWAVIGIGLGVGWGLTSSRSKVNAAIEARSAAMRLELYTVAHSLAMLARANHTPAMAIRQICERGQGPVIDELVDAQHWIAGGLNLAQAMERLSVETVEPAAARIYRILGEASQQGADVADSLLSVAATLRTSRREEIERLGTKRKGAMILPTLLVMAPVVFLYVVAPIPRFLFGTG